MYDPEIRQVPRKALIDRELDFGPGQTMPPRRFRKSPLNLIIRYLEPTSKPVDANTVELNAIDFDAY